MNTWEAMESKMMVGSETETAGVMGKSKEMTGLEAETVVGMEGGVDTEAGMDSESTADQSGAGAEASARCAIVTAGGDVGADLRSTVAGTATRDDVAAVAKVQVGPIAEMVLSVWAAASKCAGAVNARFGISGTETERVG